MRSVGSGRERSLRVLVAEAAEPPVPLSPIVEAAGHRVVGRASTPDEVERLLRVTRPTVVVFDADMSVEAVALARRSDPTLGIVAIWPAGIESVTVNRVVAPERVRADLGAAVRAASPLAVRRRPAAVAAAVAVPATSAPVAVAPRRGRGGVELGVAAVLTLLLVVSAVAMRAGEDLPRTLTGAPRGIGTPAPSATQFPLTPPAPPTGSSNGSTITVVGTQRPGTGGNTGGGGTTATPGGNGGTTPPQGDGGPGGGGQGGGDGNPGGGGPTISARARACRTAAGLPLEGALARVMHGGGPIPHLLEHCLASHAPGPLRALEKVAANQASNGGGGGGSAHGGGDQGGHGHGHAYGHDADHHGNGHANGHDAEHHGQSDDQHGQGHADGHDSEHGQGHGSDDENDQGENDQGENDQGENDDDHGH